MTPLFWKNKKVLVTGHTGFKGSWLSTWLDLLGAQVTGFSLSPNSNYNQLHLSLKNLANNVQSVYGNVLDRNQLARVIENSEPQIVFHLAAEPIVLRSYENPIKTIDTNIIGTLNLLEQCRFTKSIDTIVVVTSDKCYQNRELLQGYQEDDCLGGVDPYSASKACAELITQAYRESFFKKFDVGVATARSGNVIGGGDQSDFRLVPDILKSLDKGRSIELRNASAKRPWMHVLEPILGYLLLAENLSLDCSFSGAWNFGPTYEDSIKVESIANYLIRALNGSIEVRYADAPVAETGCLLLDSAKSLKYLNWKTRLSIDEALGLVVEWKNSVDKGIPPFQVTAEQIRQYSGYKSNYG